MHRALLIQDTVHQILENLSPRNLTNPIPKPTRATLLNVALTCQSFLDPALDSLWYSIDDLEVLFKLLPNFISEPGSDWYRPPSIIWGSVPEVDVHTFNAYAFRVRSYIQAGTTKIHISAFHDIVKACNRSHLLPNLKYFSPSQLHSPEHIFLMTPHLQGFNYRNIEDGWGPAAGYPSSPKATLNLLLKSSPDLIILNLHSVQLDDLSLSAIGALKRLTQLTLHQRRSSPAVIYTISMDFVLHISAQQTLRRLELGGQLQLLPPTTSSTSVDFPMLEDIELGCDLKLSSVNLLLRCARFPVLKRLKIWVEDLSPDIPEESDHWNQFFDVIGDATSTCFEALHFNDDGGSFLGLTLSCIPNLSRISLTTFVLVGSVSDSIRHDDIVAIIKAWPLLVDLSLTSTSSTSPEIWFSSLIDIAISLPRLRKLVFPMDSRDLPDLDDIPLGSHRLEALELELSNSVETNAIIIVQSLDRLFPNLKSCSILPDEEQGYGWDEAQQIIGMLQKARQDEVLRMNLGLR